jgi:hypothetical protein
MAEEEKLIQHVKAAYATARDPKKKWTHKLKEIGLEVVIIVFAVSISIWFHNWAESWKDHREEREFMTGLKTDLQADLEEMKGDRTGHSITLNGIHYFEKVGAGLALNKDSMATYRWIFFGSTQISPRISRYEALKSSGRLDIIENKKLLLDITELFQKTFPRIIRINDEFNAFRTNHVFPFIASHLQLDAAGNPTNIEEVVRFPEMRLMLFQCELVSNIIARYTQGIEQVNEVMSEIDKELN